MTIDEILQRVSRIGMIGLGNSPDRPAYEVGQFLLDEGLEIRPVHPRARSVLGERVYARLADIPEAERPEVACLFVRPQIGEGVVAEIREQPGLLQAPRVIWMQPGAVHEAAADAAEEDGFVVVRGECMMQQYRRSLREQGLL